MMMPAVHLWLYWTF